MKATIDHENDSALLEGRSSKGGRPSRVVAARLGDRILEVALREYSRRGLDGVTLSEIAREARISKRTLYTRFEDRDTLLFAAIEHGIERLLTPLSNAVPEGTLREQLLYLGAEMIKISLRQDVIGLERLIASIALRSPDIYNRVLDTIQNGRLSLIQSVLDNAAVRAEIDEQSIQVAAEIIFDILVTRPRREIMKDPLWQSANDLPGDYLHKAIDLILYGILTRPK